jgi:hypothetical protein
MTRENKSNALACPAFRRISERRNQSLNALLIADAEASIMRQWESDNAAALAGFQLREYDGSPPRRSGGKSCPAPMTFSVSLKTPLAELERLQNKNKNAS